MCVWRPRNRGRLPSEIIHGACFSIQDMWPLCFLRYVETQNKGRMLSIHATTVPYHTVPYRTLLLSISAGQVASHQKYTLHIQFTKQNRWRLENGTEQETEGRAVEETEETILYATCEVPQVNWLSSTGMTCHDRGRVYVRGARENSSQNAFCTGWQVLGLPAPKRSEFCTLH